MYSVWNFTCYTYATPTIVIDHYYPPNSGCPSAAGIRDGNVLIRDVGDSTQTGDLGTAGLDCKPRDPNCRAMRRRTILRLLMLVLRATMLML